MLCINSGRSRGGAKEAQILSQILPYTVTYNTHHWIGTSRFLGVETGKVNVFSIIFLPYARYEQMLIIPTAL